MSYQSPIANRSQELVNNEYFTNVYINNIDGSVDEAVLRDICETFGGRVVSLVIIRENGASLGYGFCNFATHEEAVRAIENMNNLFIVNKKIAVSRATTKAERAKFLRSVHFPLESPEKNPNVYVKNLDYSIEEETLRKYFRQFGTIINVRIMRDDIGNSKGFGFVSFSDYTDARKAVAAMDGVRIGKLAVHVDFYEHKEGKAASAPATPSAGPATIFPHNLKLALPSKKPSPLVVPSDFIVGSPKLCPTSEMNSPVTQAHDPEQKYGGKEINNNSGEMEDQKKKRKRRKRKQRKSNIGEKESSSVSATVHSSADPPIDFIDCDESTDTDDNNNSSNNNIEKEDDTEKGKDMNMLKADYQRQLAESKTILVHGLRYNYTEKDVRKFFYDVSVADVKPMTNNRGFFNGEWLVSFPTIKDANTALHICNDLGHFNAWNHKIHAEKSLIPLSPQPPSIRDLIHINSTASSSNIDASPETIDKTEDFDFGSIYDRILLGEDDDDGGREKSSITDYGISSSSIFENPTSVFNSSTSNPDFSSFSLFSTQWFCDDDFTSLL